MTDVVVVKAEHIERGKIHYRAERNWHLEKLMTTANIKAEVYTFSDGRVLVVNPLLSLGMLYRDEAVFLDKVIFG